MKKKPMLTNNQPEEGYKDLEARQQIYKAKMDARERLRRSVSKRQSIKKEITCKIRERILQKGYSRRTVIVLSTRDGTGRNLCLCRSQKGNGETRTKK